MCTTSPLIRTKLDRDPELTWTNLCLPVWAMLMWQMERMVDMTDVTREAIQSVEESGIVFIDEIDKICNPGQSAARADSLRGQAQGHGHGPNG